MVGSSMQVQIKIRFLLVAKRTHKNLLRVGTKKLLAFGSFKHFLRVVKSFRTFISLLNWEEYWAGNYTLMFVVNVNYQNAQ